MAAAHLVILKKKYLDLILAGEKTIECRLIRSKQAPFGVVSRGDKLFFKVSSGSVCAQGRVRKVMQFDDLDRERIGRIKAGYNDRIMGADDYWADRGDCRYCVLVWIEQVEVIEPRRIDKKDWRAWVVLSEEKDFGLL